MNPSNIINSLNGKYKRVMIESVSDNILTFIPLSYFCGRILAETYRLTIPNKLRIANLVSQLTIRAFEFQPTVSKERIVSNTPTSLIAKFAELGMTEEEFEESQKDKYEDCYKQMRGLIPNNIANTSLPDMRRAGIPKDAAERIWNKKILWLICMHPNDIPKIHIADLRGKYSFHGLDIIEMRAVWKCIPSWTGINEKSDWKIMFKQRLDDMVMREMTGKLSNNEARHPAYSNCDGIAFFDYNDELLEQFVFSVNTAPHNGNMQQGEPPKKDESRSTLATFSDVTDLTDTPKTDEFVKEIEKVTEIDEEENLILKQRRRRAIELNEGGKKLIPNKKVNGLTLKTDPTMTRALASDFDFDASAPVSPSDDVNGMYTPVKRDKMIEKNDNIDNQKIEENNKDEVKNNKRRKKELKKKKKKPSVFKKTAKLNKEVGAVEGIGNLLCAIPGIADKRTILQQSGSKRSVENLSPAQSPKPTIKAEKEDTSPLNIIQGFGLGLASIVTPTKDNIIFKGIVTSLGGVSDDPAAKNLNSAFETDANHSGKSSKKALYVSPKIVLSKEEEDRELQIESEIDNFVIPEELTPDGRVLHSRSNCDNESDTTFNEDDYSFETDELISSDGESDAWIDSSVDNSIKKVSHSAASEYSEVVSDISDELAEYNKHLTKSNDIWHDVSGDPEDTWKVVFTPMKEEGAEKGTTTEDITPDAEVNPLIDDSIDYDARDVIMNMESRVAFAILEEKKLEITPEEATVLLLECIENIEQVNEPLEKMMMLVDKLGADVNASHSETKNTPLHSLFNHPVLGRFILSRGADILAKDNNGDCPLSLCLEYGYDWIVPAFVANDGESKLKGNTEKVKEYIILLLVGGYASRVSDLLNEEIVQITSEEALALLESNQNRYQELVEPVETFELLENLAFQ